MVLFRLTTSQRCRSNLYHIALTVHFVASVVLALTSALELYSYLLHIDSGLVYILSSEVLVLSHRPLILAIVSALLFIGHLSVLSLIVTQKVPEARKSIGELTESCYVMIASISSTLFMFLFAFHYNSNYDYYFYMGFLKTLRDFENTESRVAVHLLQHTYKCCGIDSWKDYEQLDLINVRSINPKIFNMTEKAFEYCTLGQCIPISCCKGQQCSNQIGELNLEGEKKNHVYEQYFHDEGCYEATLGNVNEPQFCLIAFSVLLLLETIGFITTQILLSSWGTISECDMDEDFVTEAWVMPFGKHTPEDMCNAIREVFIKESVEQQQKVLKGRKKLELKKGTKTLGEREKLQRELTGKGATQSKSDQNLKNNLKKTKKSPIALHQKKPTAKK